MPIHAGILSSASAQWYTPDALAQKIQEFMGTIDLDPCADPGKHIPATRHFTEGGLEQGWSGRVYMNPPYGREIPAWVRKALAEPVQEIIMLLPARTDTRWFKPLFSCSICFIAGRIKFLSPDGERMSAPFPSVLVYRGQRQRQFAHAFGNLGTVIFPDRSQRPKQVLFSHALFSQQVCTEKDVDHMANKKTGKTKCHHVYWRPCPAMPEVYEECAAGCGEKRYRAGYTPKTTTNSNAPHPKQEQATLL